MNLNTIKDFIRQYKSIISHSEYDGWRLWELASQFQENWDREASDYYEMYNTSFRINSPLWHRDGFYPKRSMQRYIRLNEDFIRANFRDLFEERKEITGRISRFIYQCDVIYKEDRQKTQKVEPHYHDNKEMIFIYLSFRYPELYAPYNYSLFKKFMERIGSKSSPQPEELERYIKVCRTLLTFIQKDEELISIVEKNVFPLADGKIFPMLMVFELYSLVDEYNL